MKVCKSKMSILGWATLFLVLSMQASGSESSYSDALKAYEEYWQTFERYDNRKIKESNNKFQQKWSELKSDFERKLNQKSKDQLDQLRESVKKYRLQLQEHPDSNNRPYVLLNLAQVYSIMANFQSKTDEAENKIYLDYSLKIVDEIETTYPRFEHIENALYLKAIILDQLGRPEESLATWTKLAAIAKSSKYGLYAVIGMGDHYFTKDIPEKALEYYRRAKKTLDHLDTSELVFEALRVHYRLAWAAYRTADLEESIEAATGLLALRYKIQNAGKQQKIFEDAVELTGDALYEKNDDSTTRSILKRRDLRDYADSIGDRILKRYDTNNIFSGSVAIGQFLLTEFPLSKHLPEWLLILGRSYEELGQKKNKVENLERLAMLLPKNSLWQNKHRNDFRLLSSMKKKSEDAARFVAAYYYDYGIATGNSSKFMTAASYYGILSSNLPDHKEASHWRLRQSHCYYFGEKLDRAIAQYNHLIDHVALSESQLEIALYQLALASEKVWRRKFSESTTEFDDLAKKEGETKSLGEFAEYTERFANRFPDNSRSVDLLLLVAAAFRDSDDYDKARVFWKRVLVSSPTTSQRLIAIRGLIYAEVHSGNDAQVASLTERFLKLEDWSKVDPNFRNELLSILSSAVSEHSGKLNKEDKPLDGGHLLLEQARQFKTLPSREKLYRDGAYMLAIGDDWRGAQAATEEYLDEGLSAYRDDMLYLSARSYEFRLNFKKSAEQYIKLAQTYPKYAKTLPGLNRAERLATSDKDWITAARAATLISRLGAKEDRPGALNRAIEYYNKGERYDLAKKASEYQMKSSSNLNDKLSAQLNFAKSKQLNGESATAAKELRKIAGTLASKKLLSAQEYSDVSGETHYLLGEDVLERFNDFQLADRSGGLVKNVSFKMKIFEQMLKYFDSSVDSGNPEWSARSRYTMGQASGEFADEVSKAMVDQGGALSSNVLNRLNTTIDRLKNLRNSYHSQNILAKTKNPALYKNNEWIEKSSGHLDLGDNAGKNSDSESNLPIAIYSDMSNTWSH